MNSSAAENLQALLTSSKLSLGWGSLTPVPPVGSLTGRTPTAFLETPYLGDESYHAILSLNTV